MRIVLASVFGGIALFMWGFVYWVVISQSFTSIRSLEPGQELAIAATLLEQVPEDGVYMIPGFERHGDEVSEEDRKRLDEEWNARHEAGPLGMVVFRREGAKAQEPRLFVQGMLIYMVSAFFVACVVSLAARRGFVVRYAMVLCFGVGAALATHGVQWNWFRMPSEYSLFMMGDVVGGWALAGVVIALLIGGGEGAGRKTAAVVATE